MACVTRKLSNIQTSCGSNVPSIKRMWIGNYDTISITYNYLMDGSDPVLDDDGNKIVENIKAITLDNDANNFVEFQFRKNTCSATSEMTVNDNGTFYFTNALNMVLAKQDTAKRLNIEAIASGDSTCIYVDGNNRYWMIGINAPVNMTTVSATTGTTTTDANQYELVLSEDAPNMAIEIVGDPDATPAVTPQDVVDGLLS